MESEPKYNVGDIVWVKGLQIPHVLQIAEPARFRHEAYCYWLRVIEPVKDRGNMFQRWEDGIFLIRRAGEPVHINYKRRRIGVSQHQSM